MEKLPRWLDEHHKHLKQEFDFRTFSRGEAISVLNVPENTVNGILARLTHFGYLFKFSKTIDQRESNYRLVDVGNSYRLEECLEKWQRSKQETAPSLAETIDLLWNYTRMIMGKQLDLSHTPTSLSSLVYDYAAKKVKAADLQVLKTVSVTDLDKKERKQAIEVLTIFDASSNGYRSITNVWLEYLKMTHDLEKGHYDLSVSEYAAVNGIPLRPAPKIANKALCPVCGRFKQTHNALALITGNPKTDSGFQTYRSSKRLESKRPSMKICRFCFTAGWVDLPTTKIVKEGQNINKGREYLFITSPLSKERLKRLLDLIVEHGNRPKLNSTAPKESEETNQENISTLDSLTLELCHEFNVELTDPLAVLGLSTRRLRELRGFVLQSSNQLQRTIVLRVPIERITGEDKISGAVRQELMKAVMYDFWQVTGGSLHYGRIHPDKQFSVDGQAVELSAMFRANCAYRIADRYARVGKYRHLNSSLFMLLLTHPRQAANRILNTKKREKKYAPGNKKIKEIIHMVEELAKEEDWQFQLGLKIIETLVDVGLLKKAKSFRYGKGPNDVFTGVELVKWIQRIKMVHDENSARAWGNMLINALKRGDLAYKDYVISQGGQISAPGQTAIQKIIDLIDGENGIIQTAGRHNASLSELSREIANMDYYLLFYYNQNQTEEKGN